MPIFGGDAHEHAGPGGDGRTPPPRARSSPSVFHPDEPRAEVRRFVDAFRQRYGIVPDAGSAVGYDAVRLLADAMLRAKSVAPDDVADALRATRDWSGVTGTFAFDELGNIVGRSLVTTVVHDGRFVLQSE